MMKVFDISIQSTNRVKEAVKALQNNEIIAGPSDTTFGFFVLYSRENAKRLHIIKRRDERKPFLLVLPEKYSVHHLIGGFNRSIEKILSEMWPGTNTFIFHKKAGVDYPTGNTIALRKPRKDDNPWFYAAVNSLNMPILAPSLNLPGKKPLNDANDIRKEFESQLDALFYPQETISRETASSIFDLTSGTIRRLR